MQKELERILPKVTKPARYAGGEFGQIIKSRDVDVRAAFCFPDVYEVGMSNLGMKILYGVYNSLDYCWCERCFTPWPDMEEQLRVNDIPLYALESGDPLSDFDVIAFTFGYELCYTNMLTMLSLAKIPFFARDRHSLKNLIIAGGCCATNPEPLADFVDVFLVGDGEEESIDFLELYRKAKLEGWSKEEFLEKCAQIGGCYVPAFYEPQYDEKGNFAGMNVTHGAPEKVVRRVVADFDKAYFPTNPIVPNTEVVHDRVMLEVMRGCIRGCRFCQAGHTYRPIRERSPETLIRLAKETVKNTGYDEISLTSLSTTDYRELNAVIDGLMDWCNENHVSLALPSQRADNFSVELAEKLEKVRHTGLTFAPEAGTQRLRDVINKNLREEDLYNACGLAFANGWNAVKLYYMIGLPTETDEDLDGIAEIAKNVVNVWRNKSSNRARGVRVSTSIASFVPKPGTPFQWEGQDTMDELIRKQNILKEKMKIRSVDFSWHDPFTSMLEAVFSRGDRRLCALLVEAWNRGSRFDSWDEHLKPQIWQDSFAATGIDPSYYANRRRDYAEPLPWDHIDIGIPKEYFILESMKAEKGITTSACNEGCNGCGASSLMGGMCHV